MAVSMESIQEISTSFDLKAARQTAGALSIGGATPFSFMAILSRISGVLEGPAVNSQDSVGTAGATDGGGKLFETATVAVDFSANQPALMGAAGSFPEAASLKTLSDLPGWIKDLLKAEKNAALGYSEQTASELQRIIGAVTAELEKTEAGPESKLCTVDHASPPETLLGGLEARMPKTGVNQSAAAEGAGEPTKNPLSDLQKRYAPASAASTETAAGASAGKVEGINKSTGKIPPVDAATIDRLKSFMAGNGGNESAVEAQRNIANGKNSIATDAGGTAMGLMTNAEAEFTGHDAAARAGQDQKGNQGSALKQNLAQAFAGLNEGGEREVVDVKILQAGTEKKLTLRPQPAASVSAAAQTADAGEAASFSQPNASRGGELPSALNFGQTEGDRFADGKRNHVEGNKVPEAPAFHDPESSAALKNAPLKNVVPQSGAAGTPKDARPVLGAEEIEHKAAVRADGSQPHHRGEQATAAGVNTIAGYDRKEIQLEPQAVIRQVTQGAEEALNKGVSRIRMELTPPRLGALDMDLTVSNDRVRMVILVDSQEIRNILQSNMDQLRSSLQQQGLKMEGVEVFLQDRSAGGHPGNLFGETWGQPGSGNGGQFQQGRYPGGAAHAADASAQSPEQARQETLSAVSGAGLSVFA